MNKTSTLCLAAVLVMTISTAAQADRGRYDEGYRNYGGHEHHHHHQSYRSERGWMGPAAVLGIGGLIIGSQTLVRTGPTYASVATDTRILCYVDTPSPGPLTITLLASAEYKAPVLVKDLIGLASSTNPIDIVFSGGQLCDGLTTIPIRTDYGSYTLNPSPLGGWYLTP